jgi:hypothetical protein
MIRASSPIEQTFLAQWCALELASIATMPPSRQLRTPGDEPVSGQRTARDQPA